MLLLLLSLQATAQYKTKSRANTTDERGTKTLVQKAHAAQYGVKIKKAANAEIPAGYASVTLTAGDVWNDGTGYQMLLDAGATAYGTVFPEAGALTNGGDASDEVYAAFEYKIPENADGAMTTTNVVFENSVTILIPAGTYDWCITNPSPNDRIWIASGNGSIGGRADDFRFVEGVAYEFIVSMGDNGNDQTDLETSGLETTYSIGNVTPNSAQVNWESSAEGKTNISLRYRKVDTSKYVLDFENEDEFDLLEKWDKDEDGYNWVYKVWGSSHSGTGMVVSYFFIDGQNLVDTDNLFFLPTMDVTGKELKFWASSYSSTYPDGLGVFFLPDGKEMDTQNMEPLLKWTAVPEGWTEYTIDLENLGVGRIAFRHHSTEDGYILLLDDISVYSPGEAYQWKTIENVTDHPYVITGLEEGAEYEVQMKVEPLSWGESVFFTTSNNGISTGVNGQRDTVKVQSSKFKVQSEEWYTIDGRKLNGKPAAKGVYIQNGQKRIIK